MTTLNLRSCRVARGSQKAESVIHTGEIDAIGLRSCWRSRGVDLVRVDNFRPLAEPAQCVPRNANSFRWRAVPGSAMLRFALAGRSGVSIPLASSSRVWRWPVGKTAELRGWSGDRPRLAGTPVWDEILSAGCHATGGGPVSALDCHAGVQDHQSRDLSAIFGRHVPVSLITRLPGGVDLELPLSVVILSQANRTTASRVGTRQQRARPRRACRQDGDGRQRNSGGSVVLPQPGHLHARGVERAGGPHGRPWTCARTASGPGRERRASRGFMIKSTAWRVPRNAESPLTVSRRGTRRVRMRDSRRGGERPGDGPRRGSRPRAAGPR
jgi:hypothetical protein